jgi:hypothetical protein
MSAKVDKPIGVARKMIAESKREIKRDIKRLHERAAALRAAEFQLTLLLAAIAEKLGSVKMHGWVSIIGYGSSMRPHAFLSIYVQDGFKNPDAMRVLEFLTQEFETAESRDSPYALARTYEFKREGIGIELRVEVEGDSPTCKRVEIGEEVITQKKYKIVCE